MSCSIPSSYYNQKSIKYLSQQKTPQSKQINSYIIELPKSFSEILPIKQSYKLPQSTLINIPSLDKYNYKMQQYTMKSDRPDKNGQPELNKHTRVRLIQQNKRLMAEIAKLDHLITNILNKSVSNEFEQVEGDYQLKARYQKEQEQQARFILHLKKQIKSLRLNLTDHQVDQTKDEENQLSFLKKEYEKMYLERQTLTRKRGEKESALEYYKPLNQQVAAVYQQYRKTKSENAELKLKGHEKEREVNKFHKIREMAKGAVARDNENGQSQFISMDNELVDMRQEMKKMEEKWRKRVEALDGEYFAFKSIVTDKKESLEVLEKEAKNWESKSAYFRDENAVATDRLRVSSIAISPQKRKEMQTLLEESRRRGKGVDPKLSKSRTKMDRSRSKKEKEKSEGLQTPLASEVPTQKRPSMQDETEKPPEMQLVEQQIQTQPFKADLQQKKPSKLFDSVGVGTSFYYADS